MVTQVAEAHAAVVHIGANSTAAAAAAAHGQHLIHLDPSTALGELEGEAAAKALEKSAGEIAASSSVNSCLTHTMGDRN